MIHYYIIQCYEHTERESHIKSICKILNQPLGMIKGVYTQTFPLYKQHEYIRSNHLQSTFSFSGSGQIGCYLSHYHSIRHFNKPGYSVLFEDDVVFYPHLHEKINSIIQKAPDFDIIFLGNLNNNHGKQVIDNIYTVNKEVPCWGTHALLINNNKLQKIYNELSVIKCEIDNQYIDAILSNRLTGYVIYPSICFQSPTFKSSTKDTVKPRNPSMSIRFSKPLLSNT